MIYSCLLQYLFTLNVWTPWSLTLLVLEYEQVHFNYLLICQKTAGCVASSEDPDMTPHSVTSDLVLYHSLMKMLPNQLFPLFMCFLWGKISIVPSAGWHVARIPIRQDSEPDFDLYGHWKSLDSFSCGICLFQICILFVLCWLICHILQKNISAFQNFPLFCWSLHNTQDRSFRNRSHLNVLEQLKGKAEDWKIARKQTL